jgi:hypothetical protein
MTDYRPRDVANGLTGDRDPASAVTADFACGQQFSIRRDIPNARYIVQDGLSRTVAILPLHGAGEVLTRAGRWRIGPERRGVGWAVVAKVQRDASCVACAYPRWWPNAFKLWVAPHSRYRLKQSWLTGDWMLSDPGGRIAHVTLGDISGSIDTFETTIIPPQLALLIPLTLETIKASRATLNVYAVPPR